MKEIFIVLVSGILIFLIIGYILYAHFRQKSDYRNSWYIRNKKDIAGKELQEKINADDRKLEEFKELIKITVSCRNLFQKLLVETNNIHSLVSENDSLFNPGYGSLKDLDDKLSYIEMQLHDFNIKHNDKLPCELKMYSDELCNSLSENRNIVENLRLGEKSGKTLAEIYAVVERNYGSVTEMHRNIISLFQNEFNRIIGD